jgi:tetratricopeptide (TPR) repeat protein
MVKKPHGLNRFWRELKRRKVFKVATMYAGMSFILLQLSEILTPALLLPEWTTRLVTLLLIVGFPLVVIISWIFDITPEGIKKTEPIETVKREKPPNLPLKRKLKVSDIIIAVMAIIIVILLYPKILKRDKLDELRSSDGRISIAVMPFQNMTNDPIWDVWQDGIQNLLITSLSNSEELKVRQPESVIGLLQSNGLTNYASITPAIASTISKKLDANVLIYGSVNQAGITIRLNAQLIDSKTEEIIKSFQIESVFQNNKIFEIIDSLSDQMRNFLVLSKLRKEESQEIQKFVTTNSTEAYRFFIYGKDAFWQLDYRTAADMFLRAIAIDSTFATATLYLSITYGNQHLYEQAKYWCRRAYSNRDIMPQLQKLYTNWVYAIYFETPYEEIKYLKKLLEIDDQLSAVYYILGDSYIKLDQYEEAIPAYEKSLEIRNKWGVRPLWIYSYTDLGYAYHACNKYKKERKLYSLAEQDFPDDPVLIYRRAILSLSQGEINEAEEHIEKYKSTRKTQSWNEAAITTYIARIYSEGGVPDKAEENYRIALSLEPQDPEMMDNLAWFLIDKDSDVNKGLELADKALEMDPGNYSYLDTKGWGLYKQGKYNEALAILEKSWELKPVYDHELFLHLEEARKAVADNARN